MISKVKVAMIAVTLFILFCQSCPTGSNSDEGCPTHRSCGFEGEHEREPDNY